MMNSLDDEINLICWLCSKPIDPSALIMTIDGADEYLHPECSEFVLKKSAGIDYA